MEKRCTIMITSAIMLVLLSSYASAIAAPFGSPCKRNVDCSTGLCQNGICTTEGPCANFQLDSGETDIDCGGVCADVKGKKCALGKGCVYDSDCTTRICSKAGKCVGTRSQAAAASGNAPSPPPESRGSQGGNLAFEATLLLAAIAVFIGVLAFYAWVKKRAGLKAGSQSQPSLQQKPLQVNQQHNHPDSHPEPHARHHSYRHEIFEELEKTYSRLSGEELFEHLRRKTGKG